MLKFSELKICWIQYLVMGIKEDRVVSLFITLGIWPLFKSTFCFHVPYIIKQETGFSMNCWKWSKSTHWQPLCTLLKQNITQIPMQKICCSGTQLHVHQRFKQCWLICYTIYLFFPDILECKLFMLFWKLHAYAYVKLSVV